MNDLTRTNEASNSDGWTCIGEGAFKEGDRQDSKTDSNNTTTNQATHQRKLHQHTVSMRVTRRQRSTTLYLFLHYITPPINHAIEFFWYKLKEFEGFSFWCWFVGFAGALLLVLASSAVLFSCCNGWAFTNYSSLQYSFL